MEQRAVIYYLTRKNTKTKDIKAELDQVYKEQALSLSQVYYWRRMFILGREDLNNESSPGRAPDEGIDSSILLVLEKDPRATAHKIAHKLGIAVSTVTLHLTQNLGFHWFHLHWIPHTLNNQQKEYRMKISQEMLILLNRAKRDSFKFILTGDECWVNYSYSSTHMWALTIDDVYDIERTNNYQKKILITVFINGNGLVLLDIKPQTVKITGEYFLHNVINVIEESELLREAERKKRKLMIHFDNAPWHNSKFVQAHLLDSKLRRVPHPAYSPDLAPCDFGIFGTMKNSLEDCEFSTENELIEAIKAFFVLKKSDFWKSIFTAWIKRLNTCISSNGNYFE